MVINHNISAINANRVLFGNERNLTSTMEKLSSGLRINKAADDASGLAVSEKMRAQVQGLNTAMRNIQDGVSFLQTAEGYLQETGVILQRMRELSIQASNGIYSSEDRSMISVEMNQLIKEVDRIANQAEFNGLQMLTGNFAAPQQPQAAPAQDQANPQQAAAQPTNNQATGAPLPFHVGPNMDQQVSITIDDARANALGIADAEGNALVKLDTAVEANQSIGILDKALSRLNQQRANIGALQSRFEKMMSGQYIAYENLQAAESRIRDANMAVEVSSYVKDQVLTQSTVSMLAQANSKSQMILRLLG